MSDEELRALERQARAGGSVDVVLRWADALERAGRVEEAVDARLGALAREPEGSARDALCRRPSWSTPSGGPGRTNAIDLLPIRRTPKERWRYESRTTDGSVGALVMGCWSGIVIHRRGSLGWTTTVLAPSTGAPRWSHSPAVELDSPWAPDDALVLREPERMVVRDLRTGDEQCQVLLPPSSRVVGAAMGLLVTRYAVEGERERVLAFRWADVRRAPEPEACWSNQTLLDPFGCRVMPVGRSLLIAGHHHPAIVALDPSTGEERWVRPGRAPMADDQGILLGGYSGAALCTVEVEVRWRRPGWSLGRALARDVVVGERTGPQGHTFEVVDRASGETRATFTRPAGVRSLIVVSDVIYLLSSRGLEGVSLAGETLWRESRDGLGMRSSALVPLDRHVIVVDDDGGARAFGESSG